MTKFRIALGQIRLEPGDKTFNMETMVSVTKEAAKENTDLVVFPELSLTGYVVRDKIFEVAEPVPGPSTETLSEISSQTGVSIVYGLPEIVRPGILCNTAVIISKEKIVPYRKIFLPNHGMFEEKRYFASGNTFVQTDIGRTTIGVCICYDIFFPEIARSAMIKGAEIYVCLSTSPESRQQFFELFTRARATENTMFVVYVNQVGIQNHLSFWGGSEIISPGGSQIIKCSYTDPELKIVEIDLSEISKARRFAPIIKELQPWLYQDLEMQFHNRW